MIKINPSDTLIVSDWHLGFPGTQVKKINAFLDELIESPPFNKLILNGDIFDLNWQRYEKILSEHQDILKKIVTINQRGTKIIYILGNHDPLTQKQKNILYTTLNKIGLNSIRILPAYQLKRNGFIYLVNHGHIFDIFIAEHTFWAGWGDIGYRITIAIDNLLGIGLTEILTRIFRRLTKWSIKFERRSRRYLKNRIYHALILGHSHEPKIISWQFKETNHLKLTNKIKSYLIANNRPIKMVDKYFYNSGDWVEPGHCTYLTIDEDGQTELHYFQ